MTRPRYRRRLTRLALTVLATAMLGCAGGNASDDKKTQQLKPSDFVGPAGNTGAPTPDTAKDAAAKPPEPAPVAEAAEATPPLTDTPNGNGVAPQPRAGDAEVEQAMQRMPRPTITAAPPVPEGSHVVDAMVGQVNGQAIYADEVLEPIEAQLAALGARRPRAVFREQARRLVYARLDQIVADSLILGEAERDLSEMEQMGLRHMLKEQREELLRRYGQGSIAVANATLMEREGRTLDQRMTAEREKLLVRRYLQMKLLPKINVTRKDIERYYHDNIKEYRPEAGKTVRIIRVDSAAAADRIEQQLAEGVPFAQVATGKANSYQASQGGLMQGKVTGDDPFGPAALNEAFKTLTVGQHSPRIKVGDDFWWLYLESIDEGKQRSLTEVQLQIEDLLRRQRFQQLSTRYRQRLFEQGTYNPIDQMADGLVQVAMTRYALPE